jgi:hypothetical protein
MNGFFLKSGFNFTIYFTNFTIILYMKSKLLLCCILLFAFCNLNAQQFTLSGIIQNTKLEPLPLASLQIKGSPMYYNADADGKYNMKLSKGLYQIVISLVGYKAQEFKIAITKDETLNIILEEYIAKTDEAVVVGQRKDRSEEIIRKVIANKEAIIKQAPVYTANMYIKAIQRTNNTKLAKRKLDSLISSNKSFAEIEMQLDYSYPNKTKEYRTAVKKVGVQHNLFYLTTTDGNFSLYQNLLKIRALTETPFLSPISYSGLVAYKFKTLKTYIDSATRKKTYLISFKPAALSNTTLTGQVVILDSLWVIQSAVFSLPKYHLNEYDFFEVAQEYSFYKDSAWLLSKQSFVYDAKMSKTSIQNGITEVYYKSYNLNPKFPNKHFGLEKSVTTIEAYKRDSTYWAQVRTVPLSNEELKIYRTKDSAYHAKVSKQYQDSLDKAYNKITLKKVVITGVDNYNRPKERRMNFAPLQTLYEPFAPGGARIGYHFRYHKVFKNKKDFSAFTNLSYGLRNKDINGNLSVRRMYNAFNRGYVHISLGRSFDYLFAGDVFVNSFQKRNIFRKNGINLEHGLEIANGLFLTNRVEFAHRQSLVGMKFFNWNNLLKNDTLAIQFIDSLNQPRYFPNNNVIYNVISLRYTPFQEYMREPLQKVILGSKWPTFEISWRKGLKNILGSKINYDYLEANISQQLKLGTVGVSRYTFKVGKFVNRDSLLLPDRKFMRGRDPVFFFSPEHNFQHLDSTFELTKSFFEAHYIHEFNGALLNKIPLFKKLQLRELAGGGMLFVPERKLRYVEAFVGIESIPFRLFKQKMKVGVFAVGSIANQFKNPIEIKISIKNWNDMMNRWE